MPDRDHLANAIHNKLAAIRVSGGYRDTAEQIAEHLRERGIETATWERVRELELELASARIQIDSLKLQWAAREAREKSRTT